MYCFILCIVLFFVFRCSFVRNDGRDRGDAGDEVIEDGHNIGHALTCPVLEQDIVPGQFAHGTADLADQQVEGHVPADPAGSGNDLAVGSVLVEIEATNTLAGHGRSG